MFLGQNNFAEAECFAELEPASPGSSSGTPKTHRETHGDGGRYGEGHRSSVPGIVLAIGAHLLIIPVLLSLGYQAVARQEERMVSINLTPPAAPPPATQPETPQRQKLQAKVRPPLISVPTEMQQPPTLALALAPVIQPPVVAAAPAPPALLSPPAPASVLNSDSLGAHMIAWSAPRYPVESRRKKEQGTVELLLILGIDGAVEAISVARSSGFERLDEAALTAVRRWRWAPTARNGTPVKVKGVVEIPFVLKSA